MSSIGKLFAGLVIFVGLLAVAPGSAEARHRHYNSGFSFSIGFGNPYGFYGRPYYPRRHYYPRRYYPRAYYGPVYYGPPRVYYAPRSYCRWTRVRVWRHGHWQWRSVRRCY